jgi:hypothetical protein
MAQRLEIAYIRMNGQFYPHKRIESVGGHNPPWHMSKDQAIHAVGDGSYDFYVLVDGCEVDVVVAIHDGQPYLKAAADGYEPSNLLSLPDGSEPPNLRVLRV